MSTGSDIKVSSSSVTKEAIIEMLPAPLFTSFNPGHTIMPELIPLRTFILSNIAFLLPRPVSELDLFLDTAKSDDAVRYQFFITTSKAGSAVFPECVLKYSHSFPRPADAEGYDDLKFKMTLKQEAKSAMEKLWELSQDAVAKKLEEDGMRGKWVFEAGKMVENTAPKTDKEAKREEEVSTAAKLFGLCMMPIILMVFLGITTSVMMLFVKIMVWLWEVMGFFKLIRWLA